MEIERKFLTNNESWKHISRTIIDIVQGYVVKSENYTVRIRLTPNSAYVTFKGKTVGCSRSEHEFKIPFLKYNKFGLSVLRLLCGKEWVNKTRHIVVDEHKQRWEVDEFHGINEGLVVAELEIPAENTAIVIPDWIGLEVTYDNRYYNSYLSNHCIL